MRITNRDLPASDVDDDEQERLAAEELSLLTPSNEELLKLAKKLRPPESWFEGDEEKPW